VATQGCECGAHQGTRVAFKGGVRRLPRTSLEACRLQGALVHTTMCGGALHMLRTVCSHTRTQLGACRGSHRAASALTLRPLTRMPVRPSSRSLLDRWLPLGSRQCLTWRAQARCQHNHSPVKGAVTLTWLPKARWHTGCRACGKAGAGATQFLAAAALAGHEGRVGGSRGAGPTRSLVLAMILQLRGRAGCSEPAAMGPTLNQTAMLSTGKGASLSLACQEGLTPAPTAT